jgi:3-oxoacyl-[acyl-carrier protein] reductase
MDLGIRGRKALLSGASRGLGKACALALAQEGADVTIMARTRTVLERTADEIRQTGVRVTAIAGDIATPRGREAALGACPDPDILVNNAEGRLPGNFRTWTRDDWISALDTMMLSHIEMMRLTVDGMMARGFGRIVNIVSRSVKSPQLELGLSNGARSGLVGFTADRQAQRDDQQPSARAVRHRCAARARARHGGCEQSVRETLAGARGDESRRTLRAGP